MWLRAPFSKDERFTISFPAESIAERLHIFCLFGCPDYDLQMQDVLDYASHMGAGLGADGSEGKLRRRPCADYLVVSCVPPHHTPSYM